MPTIDLKAYTARAMELESAVYTQKKLMGEHQDIIKNQRPPAPARPPLQAPTEPIKPPDVLEGGTGACGVIGGLFLIACIGFIAVSRVLGSLIFIAVVFGFGRVVSNFNKDQKKRRNAVEQYKRDMEEYNHKMAQYRRKYQLADEDYANVMQSYTIRVGEYDEKSAQIIQKHADVLASLEKALEEFYEQNIIFPKYRNIVAITAINEYLMSGRCFELEGPDGAYNLYEMELRQNVIIGQLSSIVSDLEQIRNNQFLLYQELQKANATVESVLYEVRGVRENTRLTAYFARVTALIEAFPKIYIRHSF